MKSSVIDLSPYVSGARTGCQIRHVKATARAASLEGFKQVKPCLGDLVCTIILYTICRINDAYYYSTQNNF